jgi:hypothetical protein
MDTLRVCILLSPIAIFIGHGIVHNIKTRAAARSKY